MIVVKYYTRGRDFIKTAGKKDAAISFLSIERNCYGNCVMNYKEMMDLARKPLKIVAGSLGLCNPEPVWFEFGGHKSEPHTKVHQFTNKSENDVHFWLEDEDGNVWDVMDLYMLDVVAPFRKKKITTTDFLEGVVINGISKETLKECGLAYIAADEHVSEILKAMHLKLSKRETLKRVLHCN